MTDVGWLLVALPLAIVASTVLVCNRLDRNADAIYDVRNKLEAMDRCWLLMRPVAGSESRERTDR
jgi:hypothetical protein